MEKGGITVMALSSISSSQPLSRNFSRTAVKCADSQLATVTGFLLRAPAMRKVPASILSGIIFISTGMSSSTPSISRVVVPLPFIFAPILFRRSIVESTSGSIAALNILVFPFAKTATIRALIVAPTLDLVK